MSHSINVSAYSVLGLHPIPPHVVGAQSYRLSTGDAHTVALQPNHGNIIRLYSRHCAVAYCYVNCITYILGTMLNCIRTE